MASAARRDQSSQTSTVMTRGGQEKGKETGVRTEREARRKEDKIWRKTSREELKKGSRTSLHDEMMTKQ